MPGVPRRASNGLPETLLELLRQAEGKPVEVIYVLDNKMRSIGAKRNACLELARGDYVAMVDDDDAVMPEYVDALLAATATDPDVIVFKQKVTLNGYNDGVVISSIHHTENEEYRPYWITKRRPIQFSCWKRELVQGVKFPDSMYGEDFVWGDAACKLVKTEVALEAVLYHYRYDDRVSEAPAT